MSDLYIITGPAGVGKSTISKKIANNKEKSALIEGDEIYHQVVGGYVSAWKHVAGIKLCARTAEALEDLLIQIAQAYIPNDDLIVRIPENETEGELWSYEM